MEILVIMYNHAKREISSTIILPGSKNTLTQIILYIYLYIFYLNVLIMY